MTDAIASSPFAGRLLGGAVERATRDGYMVVVFDSQDHPEREQAAADELANRQVDGLIYATMGLRELDTVPRTSLPLVLANCQRAGDPYPSVVPDDYRGAGTPRATCSGSGTAITMLSGVGITPGQPHHLGSIAGPLRAKGFRLRSRSHVAAADSPTRPAGMGHRRGYHGAVRVLAGPAGGPAPARDRPTAIFAANDRVATGVLLAAAELGLDVPGDLSVVGFDDQEAVAANVVPALTALALPHPAMGERAVKRCSETVTGRLVPDASPAQHLHALRRPRVGGTTALTRSDPPSGTSSPQEGRTTERSAEAAPSPGTPRRRRHPPRPRVPGTSRRDWDPDAPRRIHPFPIAHGADVTP